MVDTAMLFVERGVVFSEIYHGERIYSYKAEQHPTKLAVQRPLAILVGQLSASAAEVVAGSLQVEGRAILVGEPTRGCIGESHEISLPNGALLSITAVGAALGPDDRKLNGIGLTPDIVASTTPADLAEGRDPQLDLAIQQLRQQLGSP